MNPNRNRFRVIGGVDESNNNSGGPPETPVYISEQQLNDMMVVIKKANPLSITLIFENEEGLHSMHSVPFSNFTEIGAIEWAAKMNAGFLDGTKDYSQGLTD